MTSSCARCFQALPAQEGPGRPLTYCSPACREAARNDRRRVARVVRRREWRHELERLLHTNERQEGL